MSAPALLQHLDVSAPVHEALRRGEPVVALETSVLAHGLPWPDNIETVRAMQAAAREGGAWPAVVGVLAGRITVGMDDQALLRFARAQVDGTAVHKAARRDLAVLCARGADGATTVSGTMACAAMAGIRVLATGGIGGVHRGAAHGFDVSADLVELARTPVAVVCAGAKSILDLPKTLELLETLGVPVAGYGCDEFPAFHARTSGLPVQLRVDDLTEAAAVVRLHDSAGMVLACPVPAGQAIPPGELDSWVEKALAEARAAGISGKAVTPYLLERLAALSNGRTLRANRALLLNTARIGARLAGALCNQA